MDIIGVGSLPITSMVGWFAGIVMALQMARALTTYGAESRVGEIVSITLVREMGPVLTSLLVAGRNASGIASELGSMKVTEQIDALRDSGLSADEAFLVAVKRLDSIDAPTRGFARQHSERLWKQLVLEIGRAHV